MRSMTTQEIITKISDPTQREALLNSWPFTRCALCRTGAATGVWLCQFAKPAGGMRTELKTLCAGCGMTDAYSKWNGFMSPLLLRIDLFMEITCPEGDKRTPADKLIEKLLSHPAGESYFRAWKLMFKPANLHHPLLPAMEMLRSLVTKLFPPNDNKVE